MHTRVVHGSILCDPIQPSPSTDWPNPIQVKNFGPNFVACCNEILYNRPLNALTVQCFQFYSTCTCTFATVGPTQPTKNWKISTQPNRRVNRTHGQLWCIRRTGNRPSHAVAQGEGNFSIGGQTPRWLRRWVHDSWNDLSFNGRSRSDRLCCHAHTRWHSAAAAGPAHMSLTGVYIGYGDSDVLLFRIYASWFSPPSFGYNS